MTRTAIINSETGMVENVIEIGVFQGNERIQESTEPPEGCYFVASETASPGDTYDGKQFIKPYTPEPERLPIGYRELRASEYPPIGDQLDAIMKWVATETEISVPAELKSIAMACMSVKAKYPKQQ